MSKEFFSSEIPFLQLHRNANILFRKCLSEELLPFGIETSNLFADVMMLNVPPLFAFLNAFPFAVHRS